MNNDIIYAHYYTWRCNASSLWMQVYQFQDFISVYIFTFYMFFSHVKKNTQKITNFKKELCFSVELQNSSCVVIYKKKNKKRSTSILWSKTSTRENKRRINATFPRVRGGVNEEGTACDRDFSTSYRGDLVSKLSRMLREVIEIRIRRFHIRLSRSRNHATVTLMWREALLCEHSRALAK